MNKIKKYIIVIIIISLTCSLIWLKIWLNKNENNVSKNSKDNYVLEDNIEKKEEKDSIPDKFFIDIKGAVNNPGVYEIDNNGKVIDVINIAGGLKDNADTSLINLAKKVTEEMVVIIYTKDEIKEAIKNNTTIIKPIDTVCKCPEIKNDACINTSKAKESTTKTTKDSSNSTSSSSIKESNNKEEKDSELVNINTAGKEELMKVNGIGDSKAQAIIDYRNEFGNFATIEDIMKVTGIGETLYNKIKEYITV